MLRRTAFVYPPRGMKGPGKRSSIRPIEVYRTLQLGAFPAPPISRRFLEVHFAKELLDRNITPTKLQAMDTQSVNSMLKQLFQGKFLSVPCRVITFDAEFTGLPNFTAEGPTEDIIELGAFCPVRGKVFSQLVTTEKTIPPEVVKLTGITNALLEKEGMPFEEAWQKFVNFIETDDWEAYDAIKPPLLEGGDATTASSSTDSKDATAPEKAKKGDAPKKGGEESKNDNSKAKAGAEGDKKKEAPPPIPTEKINELGQASVWYDPVDIKRVPDGLVSMGTSVGQFGDFKPRVLLLSHGGKLADIAMLEWALKRCGMRLPETFKFGDTYNIIQDLHQRRPVTQDKHPPSFKLSELCQWLKVPVPKNIHRAGPDAAMTWSAAFHTLDRYGDESRTPHQQLVLRYFENEAIELMQQVDMPAARPVEELPSGGDEDTPTTVTEDDMAILDLDLDSILK